MGGDFSSVRARAYGMHRAPGQWPPEEEEQRPQWPPGLGGPVPPPQPFADFDARYDPTTASSWGPAAPRNLPVPVLSLGEARPRTRVAYSARLPGGGVDERERARNVIRRLEDTLDMLEREGDVAGVTSLNTYVESLKSKFYVDFPD
jgi:hypothetical protein